MALNRIDVYCSAKGCKRWLYTSEPPIIENPKCDKCRIAELETALEMAQQCLIRCGDEWEGLSDSTLPENIQEHHRKIAKLIGETLQQLEQALKGKESGDGPGCPCSECEEEYETRTT